MRKLYLLVLALLAPALLRAQSTDLTRNQPTDPTRAVLDNIFAPLNKSQVPTGILAEYGLPLVPLDVFNGTLTDSSRTTPDGFRFIYGTVYSAQVAFNYLPGLQDYNARVAAAEVAAGPGSIPLMLLDLPYASVRPDAFSANLLAYQNGQVVDVAGRPASPYVVNRLFAAAPARAYSPTGNVSFVLPHQLYANASFSSYYNYYSNTYGGPPMAIDFGNGQGYVNVSWDVPTAVSYPTAGIKHLKVRRQSATNPNDIAESNFDIEIGAPASAARPTAGDYSLPFGRIAGVRAGGRAYVHLAANHTQLTKPLIVAEGFDRHAVAPLLQEKNYSIDDFLREIDINSGFNFRNALENIGSYDIVFIDYDNGTDDILLNAGLFEAVLNEVNRTKQGNEQNVVMGISMGGLIARYKLAEMTKAGRPTQTRLLILQDSPQRGANVPLGAQALTRQANVNLGPFALADISQTLGQALLLLDQPATRQLVLYNATGPESGFFANTFVEGTYRNMVAYAAPYRIIAVSQGSQCGRPLFAYGRRPVLG